MYKTLGSMWLHEAFCPASAFVTADSDEARNPQRFINVTVMLHAGRVPAINRIEFHNQNQKMYIWINLKVKVVEFDHFGNI